MFSAQARATHSSTPPKMPLGDYQYNSPTSHGDVWGRSAHACLFLNVDVHVTPSKYCSPT